MAGLLQGLARVVPTDGDQRVEDSLPDLGFSRVDQLAPKAFTVSATMALRDPVTPHALNMTPVSL
jgi:hypothetical protein